MCIYYNVNEQIIAMYMWMRLPREVRCYCKPVVIPAIKLIVPLRAAKFLSYLAQADILSERYTDCDMKISSICNILDLSFQTSPYNSVPYFQSKSDKISHVTRITTQIRELMLDDGKSAKQVFDPTRSPNVISRKFHIPAFIGHLKQCTCFHCRSPEYQELYLWNVDLKLQVVASFADYEISSDYVEAAVKFYESVKVKGTDGNRDEPANCQHFKLSRWLWQAFASILLHQGEKLFNSEHFRTYNDKLIELVEEHKYTNLHICNEAYFQLMSKLSVEDFVPPELQIYQMCDLNVNEPANVFTPKNKQSLIKCSPFTETPPREMKSKLTKKLKFNLILDEDEEETKEQPKKEQPKELCAFTNPGFANIHTPTPLQSQFKVFDPSSIRRSNRKKKNVLNDIVTPFKDNDNLVPLTPVVQPESRVNRTQASLRSRTKLLTGKLKANSRILKSPNIVVTDPSGCVVDEFCGNASKEKKVACPRKAKKTSQCK